MTGVSFSIREGEVFGIAGVSGNGQPNWLKFWPVRVQTGARSFLSDKISPKASSQKIGNWVWATSLLIVMMSVRSPILARRKHGNELVL